MSLKSCLILSLCLVTLRVEARSLPSFLREAGSHFLNRSLGSACYTMRLVESALPCNPAAIALDHKAAIDSSALMGSDMELIDLVRGALDDGQESALIRQSSYARQTLQAEAALQTTIRGPTRGVSIEPYRLVFFSRTENSSLPMVDLVAAQQRSIKLQIGSYVSEHFMAGFQVRYNNLRVIDSYFAASEAMVEGSEELWISEELNQIYFEPGLLYQWDNLDWQPQVSLALMQLGWSTPKSEVFPTSPEILLGTSVRPPIKWGSLEFGLQLAMNKDYETWEDLPRFAAAYRLAMLTAAFSAGEGDTAASLLANIGTLNVGMALKEERDNSSLFVQLGYRL